MALAAKSPRRTPSRAKPRATRQKSGAIEEIAERAARLGITPEKVLQEYANIAFADMRHIVEWDEAGLRVKTSGGLTVADAATIQEIVGGEGKRPARIKLYDKKAALDAIARYLGMFPPTAKRRDEDKPAEPAEDAREVLERKLARLAARRGEA
jgi:hypothetical protein